MNFQRSFWQIVIVVALWGLQVSCCAASREVVNILTRKGYLRSPEIVSIVKEQCGIDISYDEYYGGSECFKRSSEIGDFYHYDIIIFPNNMYGLIRKKVEGIKSDLSKLVKDYKPWIKQRYFFSKYPPNVVYFTASFSGFIWNPKVINISSKDPVDLIFKKAKNNIVILGNSFTGLWNLIDSKRELLDNPLAAIFENVIQNTDIYITNGSNKLYQRDNFAFAFQRSGAAVSIISNHKERGLRFLVHPNYSYVSLDLMAELNNRQETRCVAKVLGSKKVLDIVQKETFYLSPYGSYKDVDNDVFQEIYKPLFTDGYKVRWLDPFFLDAKRSNKLRGMRNKIRLLSQVMKN